MRIADPGREGALTLRTHTLRYFSNYTTQMRPVLIERIRATIAPESWDKGESFIAASSSVLDIDVYQTAEVHALIDRFCYSPLEHPGDAARAPATQKLIQALVFGKEPTPEAEQALHQRGVLNIPDVIANAGGVICAAVEYAGGDQDRAFATIRTKIRDNTLQLLDRTRTTNVTPRTAALGMAAERIASAEQYRRHF